MNIALTYDLKDDYLIQGFDKEACAEFDPPETIDAIDAFLKSRGAVTERVGNIQALTRALAQGKRWDLAFNIAEGMHGRGREAQVPALLDAYRIPYVFSDPLVLSLTLDKALTKRVVRDAGIATAGFRLIPSPKLHLANCHSRESGNLGQDPRLRGGDKSSGGEPQEGQFETIQPSHFPLFVKPNADGTGKGITAKSLVHDQAQLRDTIQDLQYRFGCGILVESYLPGREFTVGITGTGGEAEVIGVMEITLLAGADTCGYTYDNKQQYEDRVRYALVEDAEAAQAAQVALDAWHLLGCRDGGRVDIRSDAKGKPHFLEVNPLAGLHPVLGDLVILAKLAGISYDQLLGRILDSALQDSSRFSSGANRVMTAYA